MFDFHNTIYCGIVRYLLIGGLDTKLPNIIFEYYLIFLDIEWGKEAIILFTMTCFNTIYELTVFGIDKKKMINKFHTAPLKINSLMVILSYTLFSNRFFDCL